MTDVREATASLLADKPDLEAPLRELLALDSDGAWTFDDTPLDSGSFGEVVSRGIVTETDDGYRIADRAAVAAALEGESVTTDTEPAADSGFGLSLPAVDRRTAAAVAGAVLALVLARVVSLPSVYRGGDIVLSSNDPYYYRYWTETLLQDGGVGLLASLPDGVAAGEPLYVAVLVLFSTLLGGSTAAAGHVLAWFPVFAALLSAAFVYLTTVTLTDDRRVGVAALLVLAVTPSHAFRTSLGFADHHAFDYIWLSLTLYALVSVPVSAERVHDRRSWLAAAGLAVAIAGQSLAWEAGALLLVPLGAYTAGVATLCVGDDDTPVRTLGPLLTGLAGGAVLTQAVHLTLGWQSGVVAAIPVLLAVAAAGLVGVATLAQRRAASPRLVLGAQLLAGVVTIAVARLVLPEVWTTFANGVGRLFGTGGIGETTSLFAGAINWLFLFGLLLVLALPYFVWALLEGARGDRHWLAAACYGWYLFVLAVLQIRFAGELSHLVAICGGLGLVHLAAWLDMADPPAPFDDEGDAVRTISVPEPRQGAVLAALFVLVAGLSIVQVPIKTGQLAIDDDTYTTATWIEEYDDEEAYVFSPWSYNRVYNYFVSGDSRSYGFAFNNYESFLASTDPGEWYQRLAERDRAGYVVTEDRAVNSQQTLQYRLHDALGSRTASAAGVAHFRPVYVGSDGSPKVFAAVPGATIHGTGPVNTTVSVRTALEIGSLNRTYSRAASTGPNGTFAVTVPNPGEYTVTVGETERRVSVSEAAVRTGTALDPLRFGTDG